jgi:hypothetical protein
MRVQEKIFISALFLAILFVYPILKNSLGLEKRKDSVSINRINQKNPNCPIIKNIELVATDNKGAETEPGTNYVLIFDPKSKDLDFKVNLGLTHPLYAKDDQDNFKKEYQPKSFQDLISDENSKLNGRSPIAAINGDYLNAKNQPQGLNFSQGVEYSGNFKSQRSSFGISGGEPKKRRATIQIGKRKEAILNYNVVGGNGRFYRDGKFKNICPDLGDYVCSERSRSLAAITSKGYVIFLVNNAKSEKALYPSMFDNVLKGIANNYCLGKIQEGILFDGGFSTGLYFDKKLYVDNTHPTGSAFLIYKK